MAEEAKAKKTLNRSTAYPAISLKDAVDAIRLLRDNLGQTPYSREIAAKALGYSGISGASNAKIAACVHFGLLAREGNVYKQSELAKKIFVFVSEDEKQEALHAAVRKPALYAKLIDTYKGSALPNMLSNILVRNYGITERVAKDAAAAFVKSAEYAGILKNGVLSLSEAEEEAPADDTPAAAATNPAVPQTPAQQTPPVPQSLALPQDYLPVEIPGTDIKVIFPLKYAYDLSTGAFKTGIEKLAENAKVKKADTSDDERADTAED